MTAAPIGPVARSFAATLRSPRPTANTPATPARWRATFARVVRRTHLYSGLLLVPYVLIYGISAFLFNHGSSAAASELGVSAADRERLRMPADALALRVAGALPADSSTTTEITDASLTGNWTFDCVADEQRWRLTLAADGSSAMLRASRNESARPLELPADLFAGEATTAELVAREVLQQAGVAVTQLRRVGAPGLRHRAGADEITTTLDRPRATVRPASGFDLQRLVMRLHTAHGYGSSNVARLVWAFVVDLMAAAMVLWAGSGLFMWWQKRSYRRIGSWVLVATMVAAAALVFGMQATMTR